MQIGVVEQQQLVIGEPSPIARVVDAPGIDPRDLRRGCEGRRPTASMSSSYSSIV